MRVFRTKEFSRFCRRARIADVSLWQAAVEVASGRADADLGGGVFKQRIARPGGGRSGGFRTIILFRLGSHCVFAHGFAKNEKANVSPTELRALKLLARVVHGFDDLALTQATAAGELIEVRSDGR